MAYQTHEVGAVVVGVELEEALAEVDARRERLVAKGHQVARALQRAETSTILLFLYSKLRDFLNSILKPISSSSGNTVFETCFGSSLRDRCAVCEGGSTELAPGMVLARERVLELLEAPHVLQKATPEEKIDFDRRY